MGEVAPQARHISLPALLSSTSLFRQCTVACSSCQGAGRGGGAQGGPEALKPRGTAVGMGPSPEPLRASQGRATCSRGRGRSRGRLDRLLSVPALPPQLSRCAAELQLAAAAARLLPVALPPPPPPPPPAVPALRATAWATESRPFMRPGGSLCSLLWKQRGSRGAARHCSRAAERQWGIQAALAAADAAEAAGAAAAAAVAAAAARAVPACSAPCCCCCCSSRELARAARAAALAMAML